MRSWFRVFVFLHLAVLLNSCGPDGSDGQAGNAYLTVTTSYGVLFSYVDDNTSRPGLFNLGQTYRVLPGTYDFTYESRIYNSDGTFYYADWVGYYIIHINEGEKGGEGKFPFICGDDGKDGLDSYLTLLCNYNGFTGTRINKQIPIESVILDSMAVAECVVGDYYFKAEYHLVRSGVSSDTNQEKSGGSHAIH